MFCRSLLLYFLTSSLLVNRVARGAELDFHGDSGRSGKSAAVLALVAISPFFPAPRDAPLAGVWLTHCWRTS
jgi:hypothetical protein